jgi:hypothetical protein
MRSVLPSHNDDMTSVRSQLAALPLIPRFAVVGSVAALIIGGLVGLVLGLHAYPATAWFAVFEVGVPAAVIGAVLGAIVGLVAGAVHRVSRAT